MQEAVNYIAQRDTYFHRIDKASFDGEGANWLDSLSHNYYSVSTYNNVIDSDVSEFITKLWNNLISVNQVHFSFVGAKQENIQATLSGVGYVLTYDPNEEINGFHYMAQFGDVTVLENDFNTALGRLYTKTMTEEDFEAQQEIYNKQNLLADCLILKDATEFNVSDSDRQIYKETLLDSSLSQSFSSMTLSEFTIGEDDSHLSGIIDAPSNGVMLITVPFDDGWSVFVDGVKTEKLRADYGFTGIMVSQGKHTIEMKFTAPWLTAGIAVTIVSFVVFFSLLIYLFYKRTEAH